jgi:hypothetical protein
MRSEQRMRNEFVILVVGLVALGLGYLLFHNRHTPLEHATVDLDRASELMRQDFEKAAGSMKVAVAEFYVNRGQMPHDNAESGLPAPDEYRGQTLRSATVRDNGDIDFEFDENSGRDGGHVLLVADLGHATAMGLQYRCRTDDYPNIVRAIPSCSYSGR